MKKIVLLLSMSVLFSSTINIAHAADADPTISITTPSGVVKGVTSIAVNAAVDSTGTSKLKEVAIAINGVPSYTVAINSASGNYYSPSGNNSCSFGTLSTVNVCWSTQALASSTYTFYTDTTSWPTGTYQVTAYIKDSNDRVAASSAITLTTANAGPTISITTPSGVVKGVTSIAVNAAVDSTGTSKLKEVAIAINGVPSYSVAINSASGNYYSPSGNNSCSFGTLSTVNVCWSTQALASSTYTFYTDTTSWPTGTYQVTAYIKDSNDRVAASSTISITTANAGPTISITTPSGVVKGVTSIAVNAAVDSTGTSKLKEVAIAINGVPSYSVAINSASGNYYSPSGNNSCSFGTLSTVNVCWSTQALASSTYTFYTDTTSWPTGTYQVTAYIKDSNDRVAASSTISITTANAGPTISITTPSGVVKGVTSIAVNAAVDSTGTSKLKEVAIAINGVPSYSVAINSASGNYYSPSGNNSCSFGTLSTVNVCWSTQALASSTYTFYTDTTSWPTGTYQVTAYIKDSNDRVAASSAITLTTANAGPTISITTPSGVVKGVTSIAVNAAVDSTGTSKLKEVAIAINGVPSYSVAINSASGNYYSPSGNNSCSFGTLSTVNVCWSTQALASSTYTFYTDTTSWPTGTYQVTAYIKDSNDRVAASSAIDLIIPIAPSLALTISKVDPAGSSVFSLSITGVSSIGKGTAVLQSSSDQGNTWSTVANFTGSMKSMKAEASVQLGQYVRAYFSGAEELLDSSSKTLQVLVTPKISCKISTSGKIGKKLTGSCISNIALPDVYVSLQTSTGTVWTVLGSGNVSGKTIPINVTPKKKGTLYVVLSSGGVEGKIGEFQSNILKIKVA